MRPFEIGGRHLERVRHVARGKIGKIALRQRLQGERERPARIVSTARSPEASITIWVPSGAYGDDLIKMCAGTVVAPPGAHLGGDRLRDLDIKVGRFEGELWISPP